MFPLAFVTPVDQSGMLIDPQRILTEFGLLDYTGSVVDQLN